MAISAAMDWEIRTTGSDSACSGGFRGGAHITAPSAPTVTSAGTGGTVAANTYYVVITYTDLLGDTVISGQSTVTVTGATSKFTVTTPPALTGATFWNCYVGTTINGPYFPQGTALTIGSDRVVTTTPPTSGTQPRGVDYTLQNGAQVTIDNSTITCTTTGANSNTLTFTAGYTPTGADVGNTFRSTGGTNINGNTFEITAITSTTWTVTGAANLTTAGGAGSAILGIMGGALASIGQSCSVAVVSNTIYVKAGTYIISNGTVNTAGNKFGLGTNVALVGYTTNRHPENTDTASVLDAGAASMTMVSSLNGTGIIMHNLSFTNSGSLASVVALNTGGSGTTYSLRRLSFTNIANPFQNTGTTASGVARDLYFSGCGTMTGGASGTSFHRCVFSGATGQVMPSAFIANGGGIYDCLFINCAGSTTNGVVALTGNNQTMRGCTIYNTTGSGATALVIGGVNTRLENTIVYGTTGNGPGIGVTGLAATTAFISCAVGGTGTGADFPTTLTYRKINCVSLTADPFTNAAGNDFSLNNTAGGGALCRATGVPGSLIGVATTTGYRDMGSFQHADSAVGSTLITPLIVTFSPSRFD